MQIFYAPQSLLFICHGLSLLPIYLFCRMDLVRLNALVFYPFHGLSLLSSVVTCFVVIKIGIMHYRVNTFWK
jgi:hypothetical protein